MDLFFLEVSGIREGRANLNALRHSMNYAIHTNPSQLFCIISSAARYCTVLYYSGDSGGPNYVTDPLTSKRTQLGVVSWGIGCAQEGYPGVYTSVAYHYDFIKTSVCGDERLATRNDGTLMGDVNANINAEVTEDDPLLTSSLKLCSPNKLPSFNNPEGGLPPEKIIIGNNLNAENLKDEDLTDVKAEEEEPLPPICSSKNDDCDQYDNECCGNLICSKRDKVCKNPSRETKVCIDLAIGLDWIGLNSIGCNEKQEFLIDLTFSFFRLFS